MRNIFEKESCRENRNTHFMFNNFLPETRAVYVIMRKKYGTARQATDDNVIRRRRYACWIIKATDANLEKCYAYCFTTETTVTRTRLNVASIVHRLS